MMINSTATMQYSLFTNSYKKTTIAQFADCTDMRHSNTAKSHTSNDTGPQLLIQVNYGQTAGQMVTPLGSGISLDHLPLKLWVLHIFFAFAATAQPKTTVDIPTISTLNPAVNS